MPDHTAHTHSGPRHARLPRWLTPVPARPGYRPDIDGLRALAIGAVLLFHAFPGHFPGGFVGVDLFFVISGYLITGIIARALMTGSFSLTDFFARRIRRIFPALLLTLLACWLAGWVALTPGEFRQLGRHIAAGAAFIPNFAFWTESGYFDAAADSKPLLHLWSLGIEEQFYLAWPLLLWAAWTQRIRLAWMAATLALVSFGLNLAWVGTEPATTFFWPVTRAWELLAGALLALASRPQEPAADTAHPARAAGAWLGLAMLAAAGWGLHKHLAFPGYWALLPVLAAILLIAAGPQSAVNRWLLSQPLLVGLGLISFPLYLWHWPLLSLAQILQGGVPSPAIRLLLLTVAAVLAWLTYRWVEQPLRRRPHRRTAWLLAGLMAAALALGLWTQHRLGFPDRPGANVRMDEAAIERERLQYWSGNWSFRFGERDTNLVVFGDSQGYDLFKSLALDERLGVKNYESSFDCTAFNQAILGREHVAARCQELFERLFADDTLRQAQVLVYTYSWFQHAEPAGALQHYQDAVARIRAQNPAIRIVLVGPKPWLGKTWVSINTLTRGQSSPDHLNDFLKNLAWVRHDDIAHARTLADALQADFIDASAVFCSPDCVFYEQGQFAYFDQNHWTAFGARLFLDKLHATGAIRTLIR